MTEKSAENKPSNLGRFIGNSPIMEKIYDRIAKVAPTNTPIVIEGASGSGKEVCARSIHGNSNRKDGPFIAVNCAALPKDLIESALFGHVKGAFTGAIHARDGAITRAQKGTLFLDEIGDMPLELQIKILRFCQDFLYSKLGSDTTLKADIRLICASNKDIKQQVDKGLFREDLYYRLYIAPIKMPLLKDRQNDILDIAYYYLRHYAQEQNKEIKQFSQNAENILLTYEWPGNVRELQNLICQIVTLENTPVISTAMLPDILTRSTYPKTLYHTKKLKTPLISMPLWQIEKRAIEQAITMTHGDIPKAAAILDVAPSTIYRKIKLWESKP